MTLEDRTGQQTRHELSATVPSYDRSAHRSKAAPRMTRVHFRLIAEALASARPTGNMDGLARYEAAAWWKACERVAQALARTNPNFDRERFLMWCEE